ncbi:MAG: cation transporter [Bacteroidota bacterium]
MNKTTYRIEKMDCPSEEQMIRMKLEGIQSISYLHFDIPNRTLQVIHADSHDTIFAALDSLKFDTTLVRTESTATGESITESHDGQRRLLYQVLAINFFFFVFELGAGYIAASMGLVADSLDMLADSIVYGLSLYAVGRSVAHKKNVAKAAGIFQLILAVMGFAEVVRRFIGVDEIPSFEMMIAVSIFALIGNAVSLYLLQKSKSKEAHMQASMIFTSNDVIVNIGVIAAGALVLATDSNYPDLVIGVIIFLLVGRGAYRILQLSR